MRAAELSYIQVWSVGETSGLEIKMRELSVFKATGFSEISKGVNLESGAL